MNQQVPGPRQSAEYPKEGDKIGLNMEPGLSPRRVGKASDEPGLPADDAQGDESPPERPQ
jgi:hypothetical protein